MTDDVTLVERLHSVRCMGIEKLCWEAGDRITALETENAVLRDKNVAAEGHWTILSGQISDLGAKVERLRAALKPFADAWEIVNAVMPARTLAHFGAIAKHETSGVHFQRASAALKAPMP